MKKTTIQNTLMKFGPRIRESLMSIKNAPIVIYEKEEKGDEYDLENKRVEGCVVPKQEEMKE